MGEKSFSVAGTAELGRGNGMSDTRTLLNRITTFRERLQQTPPLQLSGLPGSDPLSIPQTAAALAANPAVLDRSIRTLHPSQESFRLPVQLTVRARQLLEEARELVGNQRRLSDDSVLMGLCRATELAPESPPDSLVYYHRETVALTEAALRMVQAFPDAADVQLRMCEGLEAMLRSVRDRLGVALAAVTAKRRQFERIDGLARRLFDISAGRNVDLNWFAQLADELLDEARQSLPLPNWTVDPFSKESYPGSETIPAPSRYIAAHSLMVAKIAARIVSQDYEWAGRPMIPVMTALLADVGMLRISAATLATPGPLSAEERREIDAHPTMGADLLRRAFPDAATVADAVAAHHERPDGTGYPHGLRSGSIPSLAAMLGVCDTYAAMITDRPHRPARETRTALTDCLLAAEQGRLDRDFAEYLLALSFHPVGTIVELTDRRVGVVVATHSNRVNLRAAGRPVVAILTDDQGGILPRPAVVDLASSDRGGVSRSLTTREKQDLLARDYPELCI